MHPIKGVRAFSCDASFVTDRGLAFDRRWLATDADNNFLTQRNCGGLARITATPIPAGIQLASDAIDSTIDVLFPEKAPPKKVPVWSDQVDAALASESACAWLSKALGCEARLYYMDAAARRLSSEKWSTPSPVNFADMHPVLITNTSSLDALNQLIDKNGRAPIGMERFRPNIVIDCNDPWAEDLWKTIRLGKVVFDLVMPCDRCVVTTTDQQSGEVTGKEPLASLNKIRRSADPRINGVLFGWRAIPRNEGNIAVGDVLEIIEERRERWPLALSD